MHGMAQKMVVSVWIFIRISEAGKEVLDLVNVIFERIMRKEVGGIEYDEEAALKAGAAYPGDRDHKAGAAGAYEGGMGEAGT